MGVDDLIDQVCSEYNLDTKRVTGIMLVAQRGFDCAVAYVETLNGPQIGDSNFFEDAQSYKVKPS